MTQLPHSAAATFSSSERSGLAPDVTPSALDYRPEASFKKTQMAHSNATHFNTDVRDIDKAVEITPSAMDYKPEASFKRTQIGHSSAVHFNTDKRDMDKAVELTPGALDYKADASFRNTQIGHAPAAHFSSARRFSLVLRAQLGTPCSSGAPC